MNQLEYVPGIGGASVQMDGQSSFVGIAENLRSREWEYDLGYRDLVSATRPAREVDVTFNADYATADDLRRVADADVTARTPGIFIAQKEWRQRGYILASNLNDIHYGRLSTELKIALLDGAWWRLVDKTFMPENTAPTYRSATGKSVTTVEAANVPLHALTVDGEAVQDGTPTPDAPVPVQVVQGRNLLRIPYFDSSKTGNGIIYTVLDDGGVHVQGTATADSYFNLAMHGGSASYSIDSGDHTVSASGLTNGVSVTANVRVESSNLYGGSLTSDGSFTRNYENSGILRCYFKVESGAVVNTTVYVQIEKGSTATPYVPYGSIGIVVGDTATPINLQGNVLASLPDGTRDTVTVDSAGHVVLEKRVQRLYFDGTDSSGWLVEGSYASTGGGYYRYDNRAYGSTAVVTASGFRSNYFNNTAVLVSAQDNAGKIGIGNTYALPRIRTVESTAPQTIEALMAQFQANPFELFLPLVTPQTIDLGYIDMPNVFDGAVVSITAEVTPTITAEWQTSPDIYLDYPHNYPYDYQKTSSTESIMPSVLTPSDVRLVIYGPAVNPYVIVGDNRYQVNATVPSGGYLTVDGRDKSIVLTLADGTVQNVFSSGVRGGGAGGGSYIFEKVPAGTSEVTYDGSFGFDLGWYEEEGEPPWNQS